MTSKHLLNRSILEIAICLFKWLFCQINFSWWNLNCPLLLFFTQSFGLGNLHPFMMYFSFNDSDFYYNLYNKFCFTMLFLQTLEKVKNGMFKVKWNFLLEIWLTMAMPSLLAKLLHKLTRWIMSLQTLWRSIMYLKCRMLKESWLIFLLQAFKDIW